MLFATIIDITDDNLWMTIDHAVDKTTASERSNYHYGIPYYSRIK